MKITVIAVGKLKNSAVAALVREYEKRLPQGLKINWVEVKVSSGKVETKTKMSDEAKRILEKVPPRSHVVSLAEKGKLKTSVEFAKWISSFRDSGKDMCFIIGGADGIHKSVIKKSDEIISLSRMTFPHELCRAVLSEQIYRAFSILAGSPYHRE
jgi:23S rRNA (pseudouridine1915-N3)-methyltransferase